MAKKPKLVVNNDTGADGPSFTSPDDVQKLFFEKLDASKISLDQAKALGITCHDATWALTQGFENLPIMRIPYFVPDNSRAFMKARPGWPDFLRVRYLREPSPKPDGWGKYSQPAKTGVAAYFPRWGEIDWEAVRANPDQEIIITEGELKACCSVIHTKIPTIGLGGVWSFRSVSMGVDFLPALANINWVHRRVTIVYDSDMMDPLKKEIRKALQALGDELEERGAITYYLVLPDLLGAAGKTGLDDFVVNRSAADFIDHKNKLAKPFTLSAPLWLMNENFVFIREPPMIARIGRALPIKIDQLKYMWTAKYSHHGFRPSGSEFLEKVPATDYWLTWDMRREGEAITYMPGEKSCAMIADETLFNTWHGWGVEPVAGDVTLFNTLIDHVFEGTKLEEKLWFLRWLAYPIRYPGTKLLTSAIIHGINQGTGKSLIGYTMGAIYGRNFTEISQADLTGNHNEWAQSKQFIMGDDVTGGHPQESLDRLKKLITQRELRINPKNLPAHTLPDTINYYWTSNHGNALFLEDQDRRFFIHEVRSKPIPEAFGLEWGPNYTKWLEQGGAAAIHAYLRDLDMGDFDPTAPALATVAKEQMRREARSDVGNWCRDLRDNPDDMLIVGDPATSSMDPHLYGDLFTSPQLLQAYKYFSKDDSDRIMANRIGRELTKAGMRKVRDGAMIKIEGRKPDRYYAVRNGELWLNASLKEVQDHIMNPPRGAKPDEPKGKSGAKF